MKKQNISLFGALLLLCSLFISCDKLPKNGDMDGMWQVMTVERGNVVKDMAQNQLYWSIQLDLVQYNGINGQNIRFSRFDKTEKTLTLYDFCYDSQNATSLDNNEWISIESSNDMLLFGITPSVDPINANRIRATYNIESLSKSFMVLYNENERITFRKM